MRPQEQIAGLFDRVSSTYDQVGVEMFGPIAARLVEGLAVGDGDRALDIGCGRGAVLLRLAAAVRPSGTATGLDLAPLMAAAARAEADAAGQKVQVSVGDAQDPPLPAGAFDLVASSLVLFFLPDPLGALRAWYRLLTGGGRLGISTFGPFTAAWKEVDAVFLPYLPPAMADARTTGARGPFASDAGVEQLLADAGFHGIRTENETLPIHFDDPDHWYRWSWSVGQRLMWENVPETQRDEVRAAAYARLEQCRDANGRIGFDQEVRYTFGLR